MDIALPLAIGALFAASVYMMLGRDLIRIAIGILLLGVAANLLIFVAGRIAPSGIPPLVPEGAVAAAADGANPLPQALILTAIVISFGLSAFAIVLFWTARKAFGHLDTEGHRLAEPEDMLAPPSVTGEAPKAERVAA
jgi:multicomponent Na+:H+ antiporter subunit C